MTKTYCYGELGVLSVTVIVENGISDHSNHGRNCLFHFGLISSGKAGNCLFFLQLWVNSWANWVLLSWLGNESRRKKLAWLRLKIDLCCILPVAEGWRKSTYKLIYKLYHSS